MGISAIGLDAIQSTSQTTTKTIEKSAEQSAETAKSASSEAASSGVIYEKSSSSTEKTTTKTDNSAIIAQLKKDAEERTSQLRSIVEQMMTKQGAAIGNSDSMWSFLAKGDYTVSADVKAQAQADIAEDGYWGVEQTSDRILDFAKALCGGDADKADEMLEAFKEGFEKATKTWGDSLPEISQKTYDAVLEKFEQWKNESSTGDVEA